MLEAAAEDNAEPAVAAIVKEEDAPPNEDEADADGDVTMRADEVEEAADDVEGINTATVTENEVDAEDAADPEEPLAEEEAAAEVEAEGGSQAR